MNIADMFAAVARAREARPLTAHVFVISDRTAHAYRCEMARHSYRAQARGERIMRSLERRKLLRALLSRPAS
jgi:hypothetical protein